MYSACCNSRSFVILYILSLLVWLITAGLSKEKPWTYELKSIESTSTDPELACFNLKVERVGRGIYAMSGELNFNYDVVEGDNNDFSVSIYRSRNGVDQYRPMPLKVPRTHLFNFMNTFYKEVVMDTFKVCSDMPVFEDKISTPIEKKNYTFNRCMFTQDGCPKYMQDGFYKVVLSGYGIVDWSVTAIFIVEQI